VSKCRHSAERRRLAFQPADDPSAAAPISLDFATAAAIAAPA
jgi:hypothetical protein